MATKKQKAYAEARGRGLDRPQSAILAGYQKEGADPNLTEIENAPSVQQELARIRAETAANTGISKEDVAGMLMEAANMARHLDDPQSLIAAARELGKLLGHYAPEVKRTLHGLDEAGIKKVLSDMTDEELIKLKNGRIIDGTAKRVPAEPAKD